MPDPSDYDEKDSWMDDCVSKTMDEDDIDGHDQAVAVCLSMWDRKDESTAQQTKELIEDGMSPDQAIQHVLN